MLKINLNKNEHNYLCQSSFLNDEQKKYFFSEQENNKYLLKIPENLADEIRDLCMEHLQVVGFDGNYELNWEGEILESLIDKFFTG